MVETNINFDGKDNTIKSIFWISSVISWIFLIITEIFGILKLNDKYIIWTFYRVVFTKKFKYFEEFYKAAENNIGFYPVQMQEYFFFIVFIILLCFTFVAFIYYMIKSTFKKDNSFFDSMNGEWSKYHFIPLICASILFIIGESLQKPSPNGSKSRNIGGIIFIILGLPSLIFIYIKTNLTPEWFPATIKKGTYSCLIALEWYYLCYNICNLKIDNLIVNEFSLYQEDVRKQLSAYSRFFSLFIGAGGLMFAFIFKDIVIAVMHFIIYLGCSIFFFSIDSKIRGLYNKVFDGLIDIFMMILFSAEIAFIVIKYKNECLI